jgi:hypothetical protein
MTITDANDVRIFVGYDPNEIDAFHILCFSIWHHASRPISITPVQLSQLKGIYTRPRDDLQSTEFSMSRFLTPYLSGYTGWSLFLDCDMLILADIWQLLDCRDSRYSVLCTQHNHHPRESTKMLGQTQSAYPRKNWSSVMLFNNEKCKMLTPEMVNRSPPLSLHRFLWLKDCEIGNLPLRWNHLVGYQNPDPLAKNAHFTLGIPRWEGYEKCEYSDTWRVYKNVVNGYQSPLTLPQPH